MACDGAVSVVVIAPALFGLAGGHVAVSPSRLLSFVPTCRPAAGVVMIIAISIMITVVIANVVTIAVTVVVAVFVVALIFGEGRSRKQSNNDYESRN
jgi:hypothetical protein